jgi:hypothetical protein
MVVSMDSDEDAHSKTKLDLEAQNKLANKEHPPVLDPGSDLEEGSEKVLDWESADDPRNPRNWPRAKKIFHTMLPALFGFTM